MDKQVLFQIMLGMVHQKQAQHTSKLLAILVCFMLASRYNNPVMIKCVKIYYAYMNYNKEGIASMICWGSVRVI